MLYGEGNQRVALALVWLYRELSVLGCALSLWGSASPIVAIWHLRNFVPDSVCLFYTFSNIGNKTGYKEIGSALFLFARINFFCSSRWVEVRG